MNAGWSDAVLRRLGTVGARLLGIVPAALAFILCGIRWLLGLLGRPVSESGSYVKLPRWAPDGPR